MVLFWAAFVLTRPFGATFGDLLTKTKDQGGLNFGTRGASITLGAILILLILNAQLKLKKKRNSNSINIHIQK